MSRELLNPELNAKLAASPVQEAPCRHCVHLRNATPKITGASSKVCGWWDLQECPLFGPNRFGLWAEPQMAVTQKHIDGPFDPDRPAATCPKFISKETP